MHTLLPGPAFGGRSKGRIDARQNAIEGIVGEEAAAAFTGQKSVERALADAERRVNDMLGQVE